MTKYIIQSEWDTIAKRSRYFGYIVTGDTKFAIVLEDTPEEAERQIIAYHNSQSSPVVVKELEL